MSHASYPQLVLVLVYISTCIWSSSTCVCLGLYFCMHVTCHMLVHFYMCLFRSIFLHACDMSHASYPQLVLVLVYISTCIWSSSTCVCLGLYFCMHGTCHMLVHFYMCLFRSIFLHACDMSHASYPQLVLVLVYISTCIWSSSTCVCLGLYCYMHVTCHMSAGLYSPA